MAISSLIKAWSYIQFETVKDKLNKKPFELSLEVSLVSSGPVNIQEKEFVIKDEAESKPEEATSTYVCPINSCTFITNTLSDTLQSEHYGICHPDVDTVEMKFITLS